MAIADRKERALKEREKLILEHADDLLRFHGYLGLNLDELAGRIEYSKATIYNHFKSKEDLVLGVATMHLKTRTDLFGRALTFEGRTRERMFAIGIADQILAKLYPHGFPILQLVTTQSIWEKAAPERQEAYYVKSGGCMQVATEIIRQAKAQGDLGEGSPPLENIVTGLVSLAKGAHLLADGDKMFPAESGIEPLDLLNANYHLFLDGAGWAPMSGDWDYAATERRICEELYAEELKLIDAG
jgi:AcrR family transcriptional regulator